MKNLTAETVARSISISWQVATLGRTTIDEIKRWYAVRTELDGVWQFVNYCDMGDKAKEALLTEISWLRSVASERINLV